MNAAEREAIRWYLQGAKDAKTAEKNARAGDFEVSCFLFQQAAEKLLKGFLILKGERTVTGHSVLKLAQAGAVHAPEFQSLADAAVRLDVLYLPTRYPFALPGGAPYEFFTLDHARGALDAYQVVYRAVYEHFKGLVEHSG
jgi:HEPN domain-containing protein